MAFYAGRMILHRAMANPTIVVLTDRNDLDDQLFGTFARCRDLLRQPPVQAADRADLRTKLAVASGGVVFGVVPAITASPPPSQGEVGGAVIGQGPCNASMRRPLRLGGGGRRRFAASHPSMAPRGRARGPPPSAWR